MNHPSQSIGREAAIALANTGWWKTRSHRELAEFQMLTNELCMPFDVFHEALEKTLNRPVFTHEIHLNHEGIAGELLDGNPPPSFQDILELIPKEKRIVIRT